VISTKSVFYYINGVSSDNFYLDFDEGSGELSAEVESGNYTMAELASQVEAALNSAGTQAYSVTFNRQARSFTIAAPGNFDLLITTGTHVGVDVFSLIGFTGADLTGADSYTGVAAGRAYLPQFRLQSYVDQDDLRKSIQPSVNKSASGIIEVVRFGIEKFYEFNIMFITDIEQGNLSLIETNLSGVSDARDFLRFITTKSEFEFMPDRDNRNNFYTVLLESTDEASDGTGYRLKELYTKNLPYYYETGKLVFRVME
jgi:hypothetical protein